MGVNIYDSANQIEREIRQLDEFKALEAAFQALTKDETAYSLFQEFQALQQTLQTKQMSGEEFSDEDAEKAQSMAEQVQKSDLISELMKQEQAFSMIINDLNRIIMTPVQELYQLDKQ